jgi:hypothetical protein
MDSYPLNWLPAETSSRRFVYVDDGVPETGTNFLRAACEQRGVAFVPVNPHGFEFLPEQQLRPGDLLYRPAISLASQRVEQFLYGPGVATFYAEEDGVYFGITSPHLAFQRAGLPIPRTVVCQTADRELLQRHVQRLGGLPIVFKVPGYQTGVGVGRVDSLPALFSFVDFALAMGRNPLLASYIPDAVHWRAVVVGDRVVATYRNVNATDDFRSHATREAADYEARPPEGLSEIAIGSTRVTKVEFGGVDVLEHTSGRLYLLECNFPCYFAQAQDVAGADIAGAMVDHLLAKAEKLERGTVTS